MVLITTLYDRFGLPAGSRYANAPRGPASLPQRYQIQDRQAWGYGPCLSSDRTLSTKIGCTLRENHRQPLDVIGRSRTITDHRPVIL